MQQYSPLASLLCNIHYKILSRKGKNLNAKKSRKGTSFDFKKTGATTPDDATDNEKMQPWEKEFAKMTDDFRQVLRTHAKSDDTDSVRSALRQYITMLEDLYKNIGEDG